MTARPQVRAPRQSGGFTLVELMIVVALIGIVITSAVAMQRGDATPKSARNVAALVREGRRQALMRGTIDPVAAAAGNPARVQIEFGLDGERSYVRLWVLDDADPPNAEYIALSQHFLASDTAIYAVGNTAAMFASDPLPPALGAPVVRNIYADGSSDATTVYLKHKLKTTKYRVVVPPVTSIPMVDNQW